MSTIRIIPKAVTGVRGRAARGKAFYDRRRTARTLQRIVNAMAPAQADIVRALTDAVISGTGWFEVGRRPGVQTATSVARSLVRNDLRFAPASDESEVDLP